MKNEKVKPNETINKNHQSFKEQGDIKKKVLPSSELLEDSHG